jgi:plasmid stabilization system protein ParE
MKRLVFTPLAETDLNDILSFIAADRPLTAIAVVARVREKCELLASQPLLGQ